jgi:hypothetical protein
MLIKRILTVCLCLAVKMVLGESIGPASCSYGYTSGSTIIYQEYACAINPGDKYNEIIYKYTVPTCTGDPFQSAEGQQSRLAFLPI